jgi:hypothetical protein
MSETDESILTELRHIAHTRQPVELLNVHLGLPVLYRAELLKVGDSRALISFTQPEAVCLQLEGRTTLLTDLLRAPVNAAATEVDLAAGRATLYDFAFAYKVGHRMIVRVVPAEQTLVTLSSGPQQLTGSLLDLAVTGVGLLLPVSDTARSLRRQAVVQMKMNLDGAPLALSGTVRYVRSAADGVRVGVTLVQTAETRSLYQYIHIRQEEILNDLRARYRAAGGLPVG